MNGENQTLMDEYSDLPDYYDTYDSRNEYQYDFSEIRLCIFHIASVCGGLPALVWACRVLHLHRKIRGRISVFILLLLLSDLIQLPLNLYIVINILTKYRYFNRHIVLFWSGLHWCAFPLHQLVALERVLTLKYPLCSARVFSLPFNIIISILVILFPIASILFHPMYPLVTISMFLFSLGTSLFFLILLAVSFTITCKASSTPVRKNTRSVFTVAVLTFVMMYLPFMLVICVNLFSIDVNTSWITMSLCLVSLRVISEPILCVLVCRGNLRDVQTPQTHTEHADETSI